MPACMQLASMRDQGSKAAEPGPPPAQQRVLARNYTTKPSMRRNSISMPCAALVQDCLHALFISYRLALQPDQLQAQTVAVHSLQQDLQPQGNCSRPVQAVWAGHARAHVVQQRTCSRS